METKPAANNPANPPEKATAERQRIPMSIPQRKLEVPEIPGQHLYWFLDSRVPRALQAGYEFVKANEVSLNQMGVATKSGVSGNADLGTNIRIVAGIGENGEPEYLNLMKIREEWWLEDRKLLEKRNASILESIFRDEVIAGGEKMSQTDRNQSYVKTALYNRPARK